MADKYSSYVATVSPLVDEGITHKANYLQWNFMLHCVFILSMQQPIIIPKHMYTLYHPPALSVPRQKIVSLIICTIVSCMRSSLYRSLQTLALTKTDYSGTSLIMNCSGGFAHLGRQRVASKLQRLCKMCWVGRTLILSTLGYCGEILTTYKQTLFLSLPQFPLLAKGSVMTVRPAEPAPRFTVNLCVGGGGGGGG